MPVNAGLPTTTPPQVDATAATPSGSGPSPASAVNKGETKDDDSKGTTSFAGYLGVFIQALTQAAGTVPLAVPIGGVPVAAASSKVLKRAMTLESGTPGIEPKPKALSGEVSPMPGQLPPTDGLPQATPSLPSGAGEPGKVGDAQIIQSHIFLPSLALQSDSANDKASSTVPGEKPALPASNNMPVPPAILESAASIPASAGKLGLHPSLVAQPAAPLNAVKPEQPLVLSRRGQPAMDATQPRMLQQDRHDPIIATTQLSPTERLTVSAASLKVPVIASVVVDPKSDAQPHSPMAPIPLRAQPVVAAANGGPLPQTSAPRSVPPISEQLAGEIIARAEVSQREGRTDFHVRLDPPELGTVRVHLVAVEQTVSARIVASDETARQVLEQQVHALRQTLTEAGVTLKSFSVSGGGLTWHQGQGRWQQRPSEPMPPYNSQGTARPSSRDAAVPTIAAAAGHIDTVA